MVTLDRFAFSAFSAFLTDLKVLVKIRLSISVVFSAIAGYLLAAEPFSLADLLFLSCGGMALVSASNAFNQVIERKLDAKMQRTQSRPLVTQKMSVSFAMVVAVSLTLLGTAMLFVLNFKTAFFGLLSVLIYVAAYTPLKTKTPLAVFVGAFPGAIPFMLGWVGATNQFGIEAGTLFMIQFFWQFPHFWALGWILHEDYKRGGFKMLPTGDRDRKTAFQIVVYSLWTMATSIVPVFGFTGALQLSVYAALLIFALGIYMLVPALKLFQTLELRYAKSLMLRSVIYLTLIQLIYVLDRFFIS
ncbi:MAG: heme o synthase [Bacteroidetes bacterium]|nr:heme o synthase [Bacteroidota bacterium]